MACSVWTLLPLVLSEIKQQALKVGTKPKGRLYMRDTLI